MARIQLNLESQSAEGPTHLDLEFTESQLKSFYQTLENIQSQLDQIVWTSVVVINTFYVRRLNNGLKVHAFDFYLSKTEYIWKISLIICCVFEHYVKMEFLDKN